MKRMSIKRGAIGTLLALTLMATPLSVAAAPNARAQEAKAAAQTRLEDKKLQICQKREAALKRKMENLSDRGTNHIAVFDKIAEKTRTFYTEKGRTVANYDELSTAVDTAKAAAVAAVEETKTAGADFTCDSEDPKGSVEAFKTSLKAQIVALKEYRTVVKDLIVGVKSAQGQASRDKTSTDTEESTKPADTDTSDDTTEQKPTEETN
jgi:cell division protein FtsB